MSNKKDINIIGGGASGLLAAIKAKENNPQKSVAVLEKQSRVGRKLLSTGNGRCNLTNINSSKDKYNGSFKKYVEVILKKCSPQRVTQEFSKLGLMTKVENEGRVYPVSNHAGSVLDVLRFRLDNLGVEIITDTKVMDIKKHGSSFRIITNHDEYNCEKVIMSTGLCASPKLGSDDSGVNILKKLGHNTAKLNPALCPIKVKSPLLPSLKGVRADGKASLYDGDTLIKEELGEIQFTDSALSGICVFNLSSKLNNTKNPFVSLNLLPHYERNKVIEIINKNIKLYNNLPIENLFTGVFVKKLGMAVLKEADVLPFSRKINSITDKEIEAMTDTIIDWRFEAIKSNDFNSAQVASGGVVGNEIDAYSMESLLIKNLFICGEAVDIDGDCGGYNLQFAFASGIVAGENV